VRIVPASKRIAVTLPLAQAGVGLFLLSAASLAFEVTLTHLFSLVFQYHFAFLAVSSAILGLGVGGALSYRLAPAPIEKIQGWLSLAAGLVALAIPLAVVLFAMIGFMPGIILQAVVGALPFAAVGLFSARLYAFYFEKAAWLYAFDLGGAAFGLLGIQLLLNWMSAASASFVLGLLAAGASLLVAGRTHSEEGRTHRSAPTDCGSGGGGAGPGAQPGQRYLRPADGLPDLYPAGQNHVYPAGRPDQRIEAVE
jgi:hypothetical protein